MLLITQNTFMYQLQMMVLQIVCQFISILLVCMLYHYTVGIIIHMYICAHVTTADKLPYSGKVWQGECLEIYSLQAFGGKEFGK